MPEPINVRILRDQVHPAQARGQARDAEARGWSARNSRKRVDRPCPSRRAFPARAQIAILQRIRGRPGRPQHPNLLGVVDVYETPDDVFIVTELCEGGDLFERIVQVRFFDEVDAANLVRQMLSAISFLHNLDPPVVHRDLKARARARARAVRALTLPNTT